jgi:hypothetical protein
MGVDAPQNSSVHRAAGGIGEMRWQAVKRQVVRRVGALTA